MLRLGIAQTHNSYDFEANLTSITRAVRHHAKKSVDLVLFPECATTGYNRGLLEIDEFKISRAVLQIQNLAQEFEMAIALPTPWPRGDGKFYNSLLLIDPAGNIAQRFDKVGFQRGEEKLFVPGHSEQVRVFHFKGHRIGVLICIETANEAWSFLKSNDPCDVILWPGFYGTKPGQPWSSSDSPDDRQVKANIQAWDSVVIQATCASSPESQHWPDRVFGGSLVLDRQGKDVFVAKFSDEDMVAIDLEGKEILKVNSLLSRPLPNISSAAPPL